MRGIRAILSIFGVVLALFFFVSLSPHVAEAQSRSGKTSKTSKKTKNEKPPQSVRERALEVLDSVPVSPRGVTPSVMLPLKDTYESAPRRAWDWMIELAVSQRAVDVPTPQGTLGPASTADLSAFTFLDASAGLSKTLGRFEISVLGRGATSVKSSEATLPSGADLPLRYQWISYGIEPRVAYNLAGRTSLFASLLSDQVNFIQNSPDSELFQGTQSFRENAARLGLKYDLDGNSYAHLSYKNFSNDFSNGGVWALGVGAKW